MVVTGLGDRTRAEQTSRCKRTRWRCSWTPRCTRRTCDKPRYGLEPVLPSISLTSAGYGHCPVHNSDTVHRFYAAQLLLKSRPADSLVAARKAVSLRPQVYRVSHFATVFVLWIHNYSMSFRAVHKRLHVHRIPHATRDECQAGGIT
jgi:hypothetical protein